MNLSHNDFDGPLPQKYFDNLKGMTVVHIDDFRYRGETYYRDSIAMAMKDDENSWLYLFPLSERCKSIDYDDDDQERQEGEAESSSSGIDWNFMSIGYGCGIVLGISIGYLLLSNRKVDQRLENMIIEVKLLKILRQPK
ncbi:hypothetical protein FEM48_Zijuj01G0247400 [Ziziphus jujuba var. spinosa]|uniref:Uncharacterized protein n=1 Tax=Ziziphus jujuba var. spinosa TaxID=714518 RepID=A0A978W4J2_ZIZJJ|nr:hypothetical protein FEM48_Zijuj01G0247400 [Ziziphus jujuba var. spinosa]